MYYLKLLKHIKINKSDYMTHKEFAEVVANTTELVEKTEADALADMQEKAEYAKNLLSEDEINQCIHYNANIRNRIYEQKNFVQKLIFRYIYNL